MKPMRLLTGACAGLLVCGASLANLAQAEDDSSELDYKAKLAELHNMLDSRDMGLYELDFQPIRMERIVMPDRTGEQHTYHYITFRLRNQVSADAKYIMERRSAFNEVMERMAKEFEGVRYETEGGPRLFTEAEAIENKDLATIVKSEDLEDRTRRANLTVICMDENGTRFDLFDPRMPEPKDGEDPIEPPISFEGRDKFRFEDYGHTRLGNVYHRVRERIEEREGMRLHSVHQIRAMTLSPYKSDIVDEEGVAQGEVYGVLIFDRLPTVGDFFEVRVQGLSNKLRFTVPEHTKDQVPDYDNTTIKRRVFVMRYERLGDEFFLDQDKFTMVSAGWKWTETFIRRRHRRSMAYAEYFLLNHKLDKEESEPENSDADYAKAFAGQPSPVLTNREIEAAFWQYFEGERGNVDALYDEKLGRLERQKTGVQEAYNELKDGERIDKDELLRREQSWVKAIDDQLQAERAAKDKAQKVLGKDNHEDRLQDKGTGK